VRFYDRKGKLFGGVNDGVFVLEPSGATFQEMEMALRDANRRCHAPSRMPEQNFLMRFYDARLTGLSPVFKWQLHQMLLACDPADLQSDRFCLSFGAVRIVHFSLVRNTHLRS